MINFNTTISFVLQTRRSYVDGTITPWRVVYSGDLEDVKTEKEAHLLSGFKKENLQITRITRIEEVWEDGT